MAGNAGTHPFASLWQFPASSSDLAEPWSCSNTHHVCPLCSKSLSEFWGKRWNLGFHQLSHDLIFRPLHRSLGAGGGGFLVFIVSGLLHDLIISVPSRGGYGLP